MIKINTISNRIDILPLIIVIFMTGALVFVIISTIAITTSEKLNKQHSDNLMR